MKEFGVTMPVAILGMSLYIFGISLAPIHTPHFSERFGRTPVYMTSLFGSALFVLGASRGKTFAAVAVCRFFAGLFGGPCLVLIEGTFADIWSPAATNTYYSFLAAAANIGAGLGEYQPSLLQTLLTTSSFRSVDLRLRRPSHFMALDTVCDPHAHARCLPLRHWRARNLCS